MSRSRKKFASGGNVSGNNTKFYRARNRAIRARNRHTLRNMFANFDVDYIADNIYTISPLTLPIYDDWREPTDGRWWAQTFQDYVRYTGSLVHFLEWKFPGDLEDTKAWFEKHKRK